MYRNIHALVTGGLGFIGGNFVNRLVSLGAHVTVVDSLETGCGGNRYNIAPSGDAPRVVTADNAEAGELAGDIRHIHSMRFRSVTRR